MTAPTPAPTQAPAEMAKRLRAFAREHMHGGCKMLSQGNACVCPLCDIDRLAALTVPPGSPLGRDADWALAMGAALGTDSGYSIPIVPEPQAFRQLFDAIRQRAALTVPPREFCASCGNELARLRYCTKCMEIAPGFKVVPDAAPHPPPAAFAPSSSDCVTNWPSADGAPPAAPSGDAELCQELRGAMYDRRIRACDKAAARIEALNAEVAELRKRR
jgi:hypothetical protein